ncbi:MAG: hypothetical protein WEA58_13210 [Balneolaceae bacterium]
MKIKIFILVLLFLPINVWAQISSEEQIQERIENLTNAEHVNITLMWVSQSMWNTYLVNDVITRGNTDLGPTIRFAVAKHHTFSDIVKTVREWTNTHEHISVAQPWTNREGSNIMVVRSSEPIDLLIGFTYHIETHHLILFVGENLTGL